MKSVGILNISAAILNGHRSPKNAEQTVKTGIGKNFRNEMKTASLFITPERITELFDFGIKRQSPMIGIVARESFNL